MQDDGLQIDTPAIAAPAVPAKPQLSWREKRWERRRKRKFAEEVLGWILVPLILAGCYGLVVAVLAALGTTPGAVVQALGQARGAL
ncbi:hypothetical protein [Salinarimonas soli]|uniref:Uncharacterized protein n=1 Tax=Salinarimonas soli TaxID=1638099 RepID=A0A5B2V847_9HYPH|nr:hypothetical protein [Salinarimonas soli]KAA2235141.1 hypothetical protein F0L46_20565 [Salinarimonas soli]